MFDDYGWIGILIIGALVIGAIIFIPWLIGHALWWIVYALGIIKTDVDFWVKWLIGVAIGIVARRFTTSRSSD